VLQGAEKGTAGAQDVHRVRGGRDLLEHGAQRDRQAAEFLQSVTIGLQPGGVGQVLMHQQMGDFLVGGVGGDVGDVVAAVMQVVAGVADGADGGVAGDDAGERDIKARGRERGARSYCGGV